MLQVFNYQNNPITFSKDAEVMVNATQMAKPFGKNPAHFLRNEQTQAFMSALADRFANSQSEMYKTVNGGTNPGTWMHQKLALKFAAWLSPEFELWVFDRIEELLLTGKTEVRQKSNAEIIEEGYRLLLGEVAQVKEQLQLANTTIKSQAPKVEYCDKVLDAAGAIASTVIASELGLSAVNLHRELKSRGVMWRVNGVWVLTAKYTGKGYTITKTHPYTDSLGQPKTSISTYWTEKGRAFLHFLFTKEAAA